jgi:hypothetical protein
MGNSPSTADLVDVKRCPRYNKAPLSFQEYAESTSDGLLGVAGCLQKISAKWDRECFAIMHAEEKEEFLTLERLKIASVDRVHSFIQKEEARFKMMREEAKPGISLGHLTRNVDVEKHSKVIEDLMDQLTDLALKYKAFKDKLEQQMRNDGRMSKENFRQFVKIVAAIAAAVAGLTCVVFVFLHFGPLCIPLAKFGTTVTSQVAIVCGITTIFSGSILAYSLQKSEIDRTLDYLSNLQGNLVKLKADLRKLETGQTMLKEGDSVEHFKNICTDLIARCQQVEVVCDKVENAALAA